jgi:hypothetical protein
VTYAVRKHHGVSNGSEQDRKNEIVAVIVSNSLTTFFEEGRFKDYDMDLDLGDVGKMLKNPDDRKWSDLAGQMMGFPELFMATCQDRDGIGDPLLPVVVCGETQCGFAEYSALHPYELSDAVRSDAPSLPFSNVDDPRLEDAVLNVVGMCKGIDHKGGVTRLDAPGTSEPYPELPFVNVIAFGHYQSMSEEGMQGSDPVRFYRIYRKELPYIMDLRHYPRTMENCMYDGGKVRRPLQGVKNPFVIVGAMDPFAKK